MKYTPLTDSVVTFYESIAVRDDAVLSELRTVTDELPESVMQIAAAQGQLMQLLTALTCASRPTELGPAKAVEVGTFTGYSALCIARGLPENGTLFACDVSDTWTSIGERFWAKANVSEKIELRIAPALETLKDLLQAGGKGSFDIAFIDADKINYDAYYEAILTLLRPGGLVMVDNIFWDGRTADSSQQDPDTVAIRTIAEKIAADKRVDTAVIPIADGLTLARKR